nr:putative ribonuclease H-like domain-containing protein [Tanacetum cinerariifolium]
MYNVNLKNIVPSGDLTCLFAKAIIDESKLWHRRLGHISFKTINKLVKGNLVRGLPTKVFENDNSCVACKKGKQHRSSCKSKHVSPVDQLLFRLHMDLFGPTFVNSLSKKRYCLVITDDYSRFTWVFFLTTKDETTPILKTFITGLENQLSLKVKVIRSDNGTEFKNSDLNQFRGIKGIDVRASRPFFLQQQASSKRKKQAKREEKPLIIQDVSNDEENKADTKVVEKQAGNVKTSLTLSSVELEIQSMMDVSIHQEDPAVQRTLLIDTVISMVTKKIASTPTPPTT